ncbi:major facilitator superfamily domain-containing protein [Phthorimaea operculella]|nr:major facilitator superfamily domain-containing protein [Phthorimaea operculella]
MSVVNYVFVAEDTNYRCRIPECEELSVTSMDTPAWWPVASGADIKCMKPKLNMTYHLLNSTCSPSSFLMDWEECTDWVYENENSIVSGLNLGCQSWLASLVGSSHNAGMIASMFMAGWVADKIGRKPTVILCAIGGAIGVVKIFLTNHYAYLVVEFIESFLSSGMYTVAVVLLVEVGGDKKSVLAGVIFSYATYVGEVAFAFSAMGLQYWKYLILMANAPCIVFVMYGFILKESTRWQMLRGKMEEAKKTLKVIAKTNKLDITQAEIEELTDEDLRCIFHVEEQSNKESAMEILRSKNIMLRLCIASVCFFSSAFIFCGLLVHSVYMPGNKYLVFALASLTSFPADLLAYFTFERYGRKMTLQYGYFATALFIIAQAFTPETYSYVKIGLFLCGKFSVVVTFTGIFTYSMELFPTSVRGSLIGVGNTAARVGSMLSPMTVLLTSHMASLPYILFTLAGVVAGLLLSLLPETRNLPMFDTVAQVS